MSDSATIAQLLELERQRGAALVKRDHAALEALFSDELVHIHTTGSQMNKSELLHYVMQVLQFLSVTRSDLKVQLYGHVAVMTGKMRNSMQRADKPEVVTADALVTQVWVQTASGWRQSNFHACRAGA
jgi:nitrate reductase assembly molybdenum cofactor insertion protein NarJ